MPRLWQSSTLMAEFRVKRGQLDALWAYVQNKGEKNYPETEESGQFWRSKMLDMDSRLRVARGIAKNETLASKRIIKFKMSHSMRNYGDEINDKDNSGT